jgi:hypothetical protein
MAKYIDRELGAAVRGHMGGLISLEIWGDGENPSSTDPDQYLLSVGQALDLISALSKTIKATLIESVR